MSATHETKSPEFKVQQRKHLNHAARTLPTSVLAAMEEPHYRSREKCLFVESSYTTKAKPRSVSSLSLRKITKLMQRLPPIRKHLSSLCCAARGGGARGSAGQQTPTAELGNTRGFAGSSLIS